MIVLRVLDSIPLDGLGQTGIPGMPAPDMFWKIDVGSAVGRLLEERVLACAAGRRGSASRLLSALRDWQGRCGLQGAIPDKPDLVAVGSALYPGTRSISGWVIWFRDPGVRSGPCPSVSPVDKRTAFSIA